MTEDELEILEEFIQESREHLSAIEPDLLEMERLGSDTAADIVNRVFRAIHSIKGGAAFLAFDRLKEFSHVMENVLMLIRDRKMEIAPDVIDALLKGVDVLRRMVDDVRSSDNVDCSKERASFDALLQTATPKKPVGTARPVPPVVSPPVQSSLEATSQPVIEPAKLVMNTVSVPAVSAKQSVVAVLSGTSESAKDAEEYAVVREALAHGKRLYRLVVDDGIDLVEKNRTLAQYEAFCGSVGKVLQCRTVMVTGGVGQAEQRSVMLLATVLDRPLLAVTLGIEASRLEELEKGTVLNTANLSTLLLQGRTGSNGSLGTAIASDVNAPQKVTNLLAGSTNANVSTGGDAIANPTNVNASAGGDTTAASATGGTRSTFGSTTAGGSQSDGSRSATGVTATSMPSLATALAKVSKGPGSATSPSKDSPVEATETLRVRVELLNQLMDSASELVLGRNQLLRALKEHADKSTGLGIILQHIDRVTTDLQEGIMQTRMQQVGTLFSRYARVARDLGRQLGKNVELRSEGNHVELDKSIIEALVDPLTHIVRNSVDHAIETPEERRKRKKPEIGRILLSASHESGQVKIVVEDDGRGIDRAKVLRKAIEKGIVSPAAAEKLTERDVVALLMMPGFSTAEQVSDVSGRGVGMDVVRTNVESLGGQIEIESELGFGTSVQLRLPLTLAIIPSLIVGATGGRFAVPQASIVELVWIRADDSEGRVQSLHGALTLRLRGRLLPLIKVDDVLKSGSSTRGASTSDGVSRHNEDWYILVLRAGAENYGLIVDELFESEEIVVKPLPQFLKGIDCFAGTTILGDGSVTMILDPSGIVARAGLRFASAVAAEAVAAESSLRVAVTKRSVILFAGSPTEQYLVPQEQVLRLERVERVIVQRTGGKDYVCYRGVGLPLVRLESLLPVMGVPDFADDVYLLIPRMVQGRSVEPVAGILVWRILDAMDLDLTLQDALFDGPGVKGATLIDGILTTMLDPVELVRAALQRKERAA
jgi:two-component system chemotaxis sensor kinase CheA